MLYAPGGRPRIAVVSVAHLDDAQRMMVVSLVLAAVVDWTRRQSGTSSLRALLYMDEVFGYLPPVANPPSKLPLLTLLKQARAAGVGVMLATQNPVDLDYKALSNTGTWFLGKLQAERDKARVLDGIEGVSGGLGRTDLDRTLSALGPRTFLMHNVHEQAPVVFETRWALSYLKGPLTRDQLRRALVSDTVPEVVPDTVPEMVSDTGPEAVSDTDRTAIGPGPVADRGPGPRPVLPAGMEDYYLPSPASASSYRAMLYGSARVHYTDSRRGVDVTSHVHATTPLADAAVVVDWDAATEVPVGPDALERRPGSVSASYAPVPGAAMDPKRFRDWSKDFEQWVKRRPLRLYAAPGRKLYSRPGESQTDFALRVQQAAREARDAAVEKLREKYAVRIARAQDRIARAADSVAREEQQVQQQKVQTAVSFGATVLGALLGRKAVSTSTLGRATTAARGVSRSMKEAEDVARAKERQRGAEEELADMEAELEREIGELEPAATDIETLEIKPKAGSVDVRLVALVWVAGWPGG
jgi:hypothetical protein